MERSLHLLIVDDSEDDAELLARQIRRSGYTVVYERVDTPEAMRAKLAQTPWNIIVADQFMPHFKASEALALLQTTGLDIPLLVVTGQWSEDEATTIMRAGARDFIRKDNLSRLMPAIERELLESETRLAHRQAEEARQQSETRYRDLFENAPISLWELDYSAIKRRLEALLYPGAEPLDFYLTAHPEEVAACRALAKITDVNATTLKLYHAQDKAQLRAAWNQLPTPAALAHFQRQLVGMANGQTEFKWESTERTLTGEVIDISVRWSAAPGHETSLDRVLVSIVDITERQHLLAQMFNSQKLVDLGTLAAGVAHELNSPLQVITGLSESLLNRVKQGDSDPARLSQNLDTINRSGWRCAEIVRSLLTYARASTSQIQPNDLNLLVRDTLLLIEHQLRSWSNITITTDLEPALPLFPCDRNQITQILINLLTNARDAMPDGGEITIGTRHQANPARLVLQVGDNGQGIPPAAQPRIFEPFFTTKPEGKGTGLGLYIVAGIVRAYGGEIRVDSTPNEGTTFTLLFPEPAAAAADESGASPPPN